MKLPWKQVAAQAAVHRDEIVASINASGTPYDSIVIHHGQSGVESVHIECQPEHRECHQAWARGREHPTHVRVKP